MGLDEMGTNRLACKVQECDCPEFILNKGDGKCRHCGDFAAKHARAPGSTTMSPPSTPHGASLQHTPSSFSNRSFSSPSCSTPTSMIHHSTISTPSPQSTVRTSNTEHDFLVEEADLFITKEVANGKGKKKTPWKREELGWKENPKRPSGVFHNELLPRFYASYWDRVQDKKRFLAGFKLERTRQWESEQELKTCLATMRFYQEAENEASFSRFSLEGYRFRKSDGACLDNIKEKVKGTYEQVKKMHKQFTEHKSSLYLKGSGRLETGYKEHHRFDDDIIKRTHDMMQNILGFLDQVKAIQDKLPSSKSNRVSRKKRSAYKNKQKSRRRKKRK
jgi:hypothetical protein